jgi:hypothetical protein
MPDTPEQETSFLSFPETTEQVFYFQGETAMLPRIFVFKKMIGDNIKEYGENGKYRDAFCNKCIPCQPFPVTAVDFVFGLRRFKIVERCYQGRNQGKHDKKMSELTG